MSECCCRYSTLPYEGLIVCCLVILNFTLVISDNKLRHEEIPQRVKILLDQLNGTYLNKDHHGCDIYLVSKLKVVEEPNNIVIST